MANVGLSLEASPLLRSKPERPIMRFLDRSIVRPSLACIFALITSAAMSQPLPEPVSRDGVLYATGGIGVDEARAFQAAAPRYSLRLAFATPSGTYLSDVDVTITTDAGRSVLHVRTDGPFLFVMLPAGRFHVVANNVGTEVKRLVNVPPRGGVQINITISETCATARQCARSSASAAR